MAAYWNFHPTVCTVCIHILSNVTWWLASSLYCCFAISTLFIQARFWFTRDRINRRSIKSRFEMGKIRFIHSDLAKPKKVSKWWWEDSFRRQIYKSTTNNTKGSTDVQITITITGLSTGSSTKKMISISTRRLTISGTVHYPV